MVTRLMVQVDFFFFRPLYIIKELRMSTATPQVLQCLPLQGLLPP